MTNKDHSHINREWFFCCPKVVIFFEKCAYDKLYIDNGTKMMKKE